MIPPLLNSIILYHIHYHIVKHTNNLIILMDPFPSNQIFDVILSINAMIYFDKQIQ